MASRKKLNTSQYRKAIYPPRTLTKNWKWRGLYLNGHYFFVCNGMNPPVGGV